VITYRVPASVIDDYLELVNLGSDAPVWYSPRMPLPGSMIHKVDLLAASS
jgi:hypothetical protein